MKRIVLVTAMFFGWGAACELEPQPCDAYVDYMCACHDGEEGVDCQELTDALTGADPTVQDQCEIDLANQEDDDAAAGQTCDVI